MDQRISVGLLPSLVRAESLDGATVVVADILRATTTMIQAITHGAREILPTIDIPTALGMKQEFGTDAVLGGERKGVIIPGFDQGNSPREYTPQLIQNKRLVLCTTNGTATLHHCDRADEILLGAFTNLTAVAHEVRRSSKILIVCAGTDGRITSEDALFAGALVSKLADDSPQSILDDQAQIALGWWRAAQSQLANGTTLGQLLSQGAGGQNLVKLGYLEDIEFCATIDCTPRIVKRRSLQPLRFA